MRRALSCALLTASLCGLGTPRRPPSEAPRRETIQGRRVTVEYGRAELKGRALESLIAQLPDDRVWRAGADEVTTLTTEGDLLLDCLSGSSCTRNRRPGGGRRVRAGRYSVYVSAPQEGDWSLILNSDPGIELGALAKVMGFPVPEGDARRLWPHLEGYNMNRAHERRRDRGHGGRPGDHETGHRQSPGRSIHDPPRALGLDQALTLTLAWADRTWSVELNGARSRASVDEDPSGAGSGGRGAAASASKRKDVKSRS